MSKPLCFVVMPFGTKKDAEGNEIDFDIVYQEYIHPAIEAADMEPIRADEETVNGIIHKPMYERLILCDYAVADLSTANANVFYELGVRHAVKPHSTITIYNAKSYLPFDVNFLRTMPYSYDTEEKLTNVEQDRTNLTEQLVRAKRQKTTESPIFSASRWYCFSGECGPRENRYFPGGSAVQRRAEERAGTGPKDCRNQGR